MLLKNLYPIVFFNRTIFALKGRKQDSNCTIYQHLHDQNATPLLACATSVSVRSGAKNEEQESKTARKMAQVKERGGVGEKRKATSFPSTSPSFIFWFSFYFSHGQNRKSLSAVFFLLRNQTEMLATQATRYSQSSRENASPSSGTSPLDSYKESII